jgi:hypothetical protein
VSLQIGERGVRPKILKLRQEPAVIPSRRGITGYHLLPFRGRSWGAGYGSAGEGKQTEWSRILAYIIGTVDPIEGCRALGQIRYLLHDRDTKYTASFLAIIGSVYMKTLRLRALSPNLNAYSERWVRSAKEECLSKLVLFGERSLRRAMREYIADYHVAPNDQGKSNVLLFPQVTDTRCNTLECRERLGGLLRYYHRDAS